MNRLCQGNAADAAAIINFYVVISLKEALVNDEIYFDFVFVYMQIYSLLFTFNLAINTILDYLE